MLVLVFVIVAWIVNSVVNQPEFTRVRVHVNAIDQANAANDTVLVTAVLLVDQTYFSRVVFVKNAVIENDESVLTEHNLIFAGIPDLFGGDSISFQVSGGRIMAEILGVVGKVGQGVIGLGDEQELAIVVSRDSRVHGSVFTL